MWSFRWLPNPTKRGWRFKQDRLSRAVPAVSDCPLRLFIIDNFFSRLEFLTTQKFDIEQLRFDHS